MKLVKVYPLAKASNPPAQRFVDMTDIMYEGLVHYDESFYTSLARMLNEEPVQPEDLQMMGMLLPLGMRFHAETANAKQDSCPAKVFTLALRPRRQPPRGLSFYRLKFLSSYPAAISARRRITESDRARLA